MAERLRIARELHDMVAHSIGIIAIQAGVGRRVIDTQPAEARNALTVIEATSRETLAGLRHGEIAGRLVISAATAKAHVDRLLAKLGARDRIQLVIAAYQAGLVFPSDGPPHEPRPDSRGK